MPPTRLLMAALPPMLCDIVRALAAEAPGFEIVAQVGPEADLSAAIEGCRANVVMMGETSAPAGEHLLLKHPQLRVLTLGDGARVGYLDRLVPQRTVISDVSPDELMDAILGIGRFG